MFAPGFLVFRKEVSVFGKGLPAFARRSFVFARRLAVFGRASRGEGVLVDLMAFEAAEEGKIALAVPAPADLGEAAAR